MHSQISYVLHTARELRDDLYINNPIYESVFVVMDNPAVGIIADAFGMNPGYFAEPIHDGRYVQFDIHKVESVIRQLEAMQKETPSN